MPHEILGSRHVTRFAPSPTGDLHLGHVAHAAWLWGAARVLHARVIVRIEDHDRGRSRREHERRILADLDWLGFQPESTALQDLVAGKSTYRQQDAEPDYLEALEVLRAAGLVYGCDCTRSMIAEEVGDGRKPGAELRYPGTCRDRGLPLDGTVGVRVRMPDEAITFADRILGPQRQVPAEQCGDLLVRDRHGNWTYQFAVTVDDMRHGITLVIRGDDLLSSTGRQILLARLLGRPIPPLFLHHPLVRNDKGVKLSKRDRSAALSELRRAGHSPAKVIGMALAATGVVEAPLPVSLDELGAVFEERLASRYASG